MQSVNLNEWTPEEYDGGYTSPIDRKFTGGSRTCEVFVHFDDLEEWICQYLLDPRYPVVVGCVAWLTNPKIIEHLSKKEKVSIIIQKEDFLRPDSGDWSAQKLKYLYSKLPGGIDCFEIFNGVPSLNFNWAWEVEPIRWAGVFNNEKAAAIPRMHHKFLVFCSRSESKPEPGDDYGFYGSYLVPECVWTGSFNFTKNGTNSLENGMFVVGFETALKYFYEWQHVLAISESIPDFEWGRHWSAPEYFRIGT
jgi:hypothetical protein